MTALTDDMKRSIVSSLACYSTPSEVAAEVEKRFGIKIHRRHVYAYDPDCQPPPAQRWIDLHTATRQRFIDEMSRIPIFHKSVRLRMLGRMCDRAEQSGNYFLVANLLEQAAKECGGFFERNPTSQPSQDSNRTATEFRRASWGSTKRSGNHDANDKAARGGTPA